MCNPSPARVLRNVKRITKFLERKSTSQSTQQILTTCSQPGISIESKSQPLALSVVKNTEINIRPRKIYHPTTINACLAMFNNHPDALTQEEILKFNHYKSWKKESGDPLETNPIYLPIGGLRTCLVCKHFT